MRGRRKPRRAARAGTRRCVVGAGEWPLGRARAQWGAAGGGACAVRRAGGGACAVRRGGGRRVRSAARRGHGGRRGGARGPGRGAAGGLGRPRPLLPHRRDREALLHRGDPRRDHGHRELPDPAVGQAVGVVPALHAGAGHARGGEGPRWEGDPVAAVRLRGPLHLHVAHAGRAPDLPALQLHPHGALRRRQAAGAPGHPGGRAHQQLPRDRRQGQADGAAAPRAPAARPGGADPEGAELPAVPRGALPHDEREHQPARALVVHRPDRHPHPHRHLADAPPQELLRGQEARVARAAPPQ